MGSAFIVADFDDKNTNFSCNIQLLPASTKNQMLALGHIVPLCFNK